MKFVSLGDASDELTFEQALLKGIAADGSLYVSKFIPQIASAGIIGTDRYELAQIMLSPFVGDEVPAEDLEAIIQRASSFDTPLVTVGDRRVLEMFHGPTMAFKDVAARYLAEFMNYFNQKAGRRSTVLVATSGDTGGAIAHGFAGVDCIDLVVLYPKGRVSRLQLEQLRRVARNVRSLEVDGDFNDCQNLVKEAFADQELTVKFNLTSANSINVGRLLPQTTYYASIYSQLGKPVERVVVPTGNLGNLCAGLLARAMGVPIGQFTAATNANDSLVRYLGNGEYVPKATIRTMSNAMDVNSPNNLPRFNWLFNDNLDEIRKVVQAVRIDDDATAETIKQVYAETGYLLDPHTAVGWRASQEIGGKGDVIVSTASPLKFAEEIFAKSGIKVDNGHLLEELRRKPERYTAIGSSLSDLRKVLFQVE